MFGFFRLLAALSVVLTHIGGVEFVAGVAVWGFFMLSGLLMTAALDSRYGTDGHGVSRFLFNRALRLYPAYWLTLLLTTGILLAFGDQTDPTLVNTAFVFPATFREWFSNILIIGQTTMGLGRVPSSLAPASWAVDVEILMYFCSCIFLARNRRVAISTLAVLVLIFPMLWWIARGMVAHGDVTVASQLLYSFLPAALLPYSIGTVLWFYRGWWRTKVIGFHWGIAGAVGLIGTVLWVYPMSVTAAYLFSLPWLAILLCVLMSWRPEGKLRALDDFAGRMSYPLYLTHWLCAYLAVLVLPASRDWVMLVDDKYLFGVSGFFAVSALAISISAFFAWSVEGPVERLRHGFRAGVHRATNDATSS